MALTVKRVDKLRHAGKPGKHTDTGHVRGLMLVVENASSASWVLRYQRNGVVRSMGLGSARDIKLSAARELARRAREQLVAGQDPLEARRQVRAATVPKPTNTFQQAAERFYEAHEASWSNAKHRAAFLSTLEQWAFPLIGKLDVAAIGKAEVLRVLEQRTPPAGESFWRSRTVTADRVRGRIASVLDYATARDWRPAGVNPAHWKGFLSTLLPSPRAIAPVKHHRALAYADVPALMLKLAEDASVAAQALRFIVLTSARLDEALNATRSELDLDAAEWTIPAERMKGRRPHRVPLSPQVLALLDALPREDGNPFLFISARVPGIAVSEMSVTRTRRAAGCNATTHGFRSAFKTWASERGRFGHDEIELSLAHVVGNTVERSYQRGELLDKRRRLMEAWSLFCTSPPVIADDVVVPMHGRA